MLGQSAGARRVLMRPDPALCAAGQWETAARLVQGMTDASCRADSVTFTCLIAAYERGGQWAPALQVPLLGLA